MKHFKFENQPNQAKILSLIKNNRFRSCLPRKAAKPYFSNSKNSIFTFYK